MCIFFHLRDGSCSCCPPHFTTADASLVWKDNSDGKRIHEIAQLLSVRCSTNCQMVRCLSKCVHPRCGHHPLAVYYTQPVSHTLVSSSAGSYRPSSALVVHRAKASAVLNNRLCRYRSRSRRFRAGVPLFITLLLSGLFPCLAFYAAVHRGQLRMCMRHFRVGNHMRTTMRVQTIA